jgi:uncharacterized protein YgiM (DUF1202 family)
MFRLKSTLLFLTVAVLLAAFATSCGGDGETEPTVPPGGQLPTVVINQPADQALIPAGQAIDVQVVASHDQSVSRIELYIDNSLVESRMAPAGSALTTVQEVFRWSASIVGRHTLQARAYDATGQMGASPIIAVDVQVPGAPTSAPVQPTLPPAQATATPTVPPQPAASPTPEQPLVTANVNANVRGGPGTNYPVVGALLEGDSAVVTGRNTDSSWWQISFQGGVAWIANSVATANAPAANAPVASAPPPPPTNTPIPPTAPPPTATSAPTAGFSADTTALSAGQCTTLRWNFSGIKALFISFGLGYDKEGVAGQGTRQVCPSVTTTYEAAVTRPDNSQETQQVTINVGGGGCGDPYITRFTPTTYSVASGTPFSIHWDVDCAATVHFIQVGTSEEPVGGHSQKIDVKIYGDTRFQLRVGKTGGGFVVASFTVRLK